MISYTTEYNCLQCGEILDAVTPVNNDTDVPNSGDISICYSCGHVMIFTDDIRVVRKLEYDDLTVKEKERIDIITKTIKISNRINRKNY